MKKTDKTNVIVKGVAAVCAFLASMMLICHVFVMSTEATNVSTGYNLFKCWEVGLDGAPTEFALMTICFSIAFFLGLVLAILFVANIFFDNKLIEKILMIAAIVFAVVIIVGLICTFVYASNTTSTVEVDTATIGFTTSVGIGAILTTIFGVATAAMIFAGKALKK